MTEHTPGPWTTVGRAIGGAKVGIARDEHNPQPFATVHGSGSDDGDKIADANSRLIASAPNLLAALQRLNVSYYPFKKRKGESSMEASIRWSDEQHKAHDAARTAIAKATGESQ
jgi:hypothetical protein